MSSSRAAAWSCGRRWAPAPALRGTLIRSCLPEGRAAEAGFAHGSHALHWAFHNGLGLVFVAAYRRALHLLYVDALLATVREGFARDLHLEAEACVEWMRRPKQAVASRLPAITGKKPRAGARAGSQGGGKKKGLSLGKEYSDDGDSGNGHIACAMVA